MVKKLTIKKDPRGKLIEVFKFPNIGQVFYSTSKPGIIRGNHYHLRKVEIFCVIEGTATIQLRDRKTNEVLKFKVSGDEPQTISMPINWTHNIQNTGNNELKLLVWANEVFDQLNPDTFAEEV